MIVKKLLQKHDFNKSYHGGLNSYSIVLMTSTFIENEGINEVSSIGCNLEQFFNFYGNYFDP
jgi:DNA polymerase sigma